VLGARRWLPLLLIPAGLVVYAGSLDHPFIFDDETEIVSNERVHDLTPLSNALSSQRPVTDLTFAINYANHNLNPAGFRAVNVAIHILAALFLYGIVRRTLLAARLRPVLGAASPWIALSVAVIWLLHPLQTQSVTYIVQRAESLMGLFYLITIYSVLRGAESKAALGWYVAAVLACALGMGSKAVMVTAPIMVLIYDRAFLSQSWSDAVRRRTGLYIGLAATWLIPLATGVVRGVLSPRESLPTVGFGVRELTPAVYAMTEPGVILHYIKLALWPVNLCLDYGWQPVHNLSQATMPIVVVGILLLLTLWAVVWRPIAGFLGAWFFLILAPTSSFIPLADPIFEHRMYLPLAALVTLAVVAVYGVLIDVMRSDERAPAARHYVAAILLVVTCGTLGYLTIRRNHDYRSSEVMWADVLAKRPNNPRAHLAVGVGHYDADRVPEAEKAFRRAIELDPKYGEAYFNLGNTLMKKGWVGDAVLAYRAGIATGYYSAADYYNLGNALRRMEKFPEAVDAYSLATWVDPNHAESYLHIGNVYMENGFFRDALKYYESAIEAKPDYALAYLNMGAVFMEQSRYLDAIEAFEKALELKPDYEIACNNLEQAWAGLTGTPAPQPDPVP